MEALYFLEIATSGGKKQQRCTVVTPAREAGGAGGAGRALSRWQCREAWGSPAPGLFLHEDASKARGLVRYVGPPNLPSGYAAMSHSKNRVARKKRAATMGPMKNALPENFV